MEPVLYVLEYEGTNGRDDFETDDLEKLAGAVREILGGGCVGPIEDWVVRVYEQKWEEFAEPGMDYSYWGFVEDYEFRGEQIFSLFPVFKGVYNTFDGSLHKRLDVRPEPRFYFPLNPEYEISDEDADELEAVLEKQNKVFRSYCVGEEL